jgi:Zn-dependent protease with chaperone function
MSAERRSFPDIHADAFIHDADRAALEALRGVPGLDTLGRKLASGSVERKFHAIHSRTAVRLGPRQYPSLYKMVEQACEILDLEVPVSYVSGHFQVNAYAFGFTEYTLTLNAGLVDQMEDEEVLAVIGHELGHILCDHMLYKSMAHLISMYGLRGLGMVFGGLTKLLTVPLQLALLNWSRAAEYSCDRAGLLVVQDPQVVGTTLVKLAGGPKRFRHEFDLSAVHAQYRDFEDTASTTDKLYALWHEANRTHPDPIWRANAILEWSEGQRYRDIMAGRYLKRTEVAQRLEPAIEGMYQCPACDTWVPRGRPCHTCGLREADEHRQRCPEGHIADLGWRFCRRCGARLGAEG